MNIKVVAARLKRKYWRGALSIFDEIFKTEYSWDYAFKLNGYHDNQYRFGKDKIAFVHIPKTGGTSFYKMLEQTPDHNFIKIKVHCPISIYCPPDQFRYVTIIRNPVARVWSLYQMALRNKKGFPYKKYADKGLDCFLKNCWEANNMACQYYSGQVKQKVNNNTFTSASKNLKQFYKVISFENFNTEIQVFFEKENIQFTKILHERNSKYNAPNEIEIGAIEKYNSYDIQLFNQWKKTR